MGAAECIAGYVRAHLNIVKNECRYPVVQPLLELFSRRVYTAKLIKSDFEEKFTGIMKVAKDISATRTFLHHKRENLIELKISEVLCSDDVQVLIQRIDARLIALITFVSNCFLHKSIYFHIKKKIIILITNKIPILQ